MIGQTIAHYRISDKLGAGGMGEVYLAEDLNLKRTVALKFLPASFAAGEDFRSRFRHEAQAAAALNHPNIVTVYDLGEHEGRLYIVMEHVAGQTLDELVASNRLTMSTALDIGAQIAEGLAAAHDAGIVHRDIKPTNILVDQKGRVKILDFGLAKVRGATKITKEGSTLGTVQYNSPEQARGEEVDQRSDIFSFGCVLYELITGRPAFTGDYDAAIIYAIAHETPDPLARFSSTAPEALQRIIDKALAKSPAERYQRLDDLLVDLHAVQKTGSERPTPGTTSRLRVALPVALLFIVALAVLIFRPWKFEISTTHEAQAVENRLAIMNFENLADVEDSRRLGAISANLLITDLSETEALQVVSSQRIHDLRKQIGDGDTDAVDKDIADEVARRARARWLLLGSVVQQEPTLTLTAQLVDVTTGDAVASQRVSGAGGDDIFSVIDKLAEELRQDMSLTAANEPDVDKSVADVTTASEEAYRRYLSGMRLLYLYNNEAAVKEFHRARRLDTTFAMAYFRIATSDFLRRRGTIFAWPMQMAIAHAKSASKKERMYIDALQAIFEENYEEGIARLDKIIEKYPDEKEAFLFKGGIEQFLNSRPRAAIAAFAEALKLDPDYGLAHNYQGYAYYAAGDVEKALHAIDRYIALAPNEPNPYDSKGDIYGKSGNLDKAIQSYRRARKIEDSLRLEAPSCVSCFDLALCYLYKGKFSTAEQLCKQMMNSEHRIVRVAGRRTLAYALAYQGRIHEAKKFLEQSIQADSLEFGRNVLWYKFRALSRLSELYDTVDTAHALNLIAYDLATAADESDWIEPHMIRLLVKAGDTTAARNRLSGFVTRLTETPPDVRWLGSWAEAMYYSEVEKYDTAIVILQETLPRLNPDRWDMSAVRFQLADTYLVSERYGEAISVYREILDNFTTDIGLALVERPLIHYRLGIAYEATGSPGRAREEYNKFLEIWKNADEDLPQLVDARQRLQDLQ